MTRFIGALALIACSLATPAQAATATLNLVISVVVSSGPCGASVAQDAVNVSCGAYAPLPALPPVMGLGSASPSAILAGAFGIGALPFAGGTSVEETQSQATDAQAPSGQAVPGDRPAREVAVLPTWATGNNPMALYSTGANLSSWRVVSNDNVQHVELTISW